MSFLQTAKAVVLTLSAVYMHLVPLANAQHGTQHMDAHRRSSLAVVIDGSKTPNLVSTDLAFKHLMLALSTADQPSERDLARQIAGFDAIGLDRADRQVLVMELARMRLFLGQIEAERSLADRGGDPADTLPRLLKQQNEILTRTVASVLATLSKDGVDRAQRYVADHFRKSIVIYGTPH
jgi:hypothetical protein